MILAVTVAVVAGAFASFQRKRSSFERIDFTFTRDNGLVVVKNVDPGSGAEASGLRPGDQIWLIGETPSSEIEGLQKTLRRIGQKVPLVVAREGKTVRLNYLVPELKIDYAYLILSFIGFLYLAIGLFTLFRGGRTESTLFYFVTLLSFIVYVYTPAGDIDATYKLLQLVEEFATILLPPLTLNFFLVFPRPIVRYRRLIAAMYIPPALLAAWDLDLLVLGNRLAIASPYRSLLLVQHWELVHFAIYFTLAIVALAYTYRTAAAVGKKQIKWIYLGMALGFVPFLLVYLVPYLVIGSVKPIYS
ncbi:MAG TPA: PDZ domain-containing protein, partial [Thermoanaerobaculia bacterium]